MSGYKHIETAVAAFIAARYRSAAEIGAGENLHAASLLLRAGVDIICTDWNLPSGFMNVPYYRDDITAPDVSIYSGRECLYAIRPVEEMIDPMIRLAREINADLFVYHLGFEGYGPQKPVPGCRVPLHQYFSRN